MIFIDPDGMVVEYVGSEEEVKQLKKNNRILRRKSRTFRKMYRDLKRDKHTHTFAATDGKSITMAAESFDVKDGKVDESSIKEAKHNEDGNNTLIRINFEEEAFEGGNTLSITGHETGHSWRMARGLVETEDGWPKPDYSNPNFDLTAYRSDRHSRQSNKKITEETEATNIENMVRSEIGLKPRTKYENIKTVQMDPVTGAVEVVEKTANASRKVIQSHKHNIHKHYNLSPIKKN